MKIKYIFILLFLLTLCGCSATVDLKLNEKTIEESITIDSYVNEEMTKTMVYNSFREFIPVYYDDFVPDLQEDVKLKGISYYNREVKDLGNGYRFLYRYNFPFSQYSNAQSVKSNFKSSFISKDEEGIITLSTDSMGSMLIRQYDALSSIKININTEGYEVLESNGEEGNGVYSWTFTKNDNAHSIYLKLKKKDTKKEESPITNNPSSSKKEEDSFISQHPFLFIILGLGFFFLFLFLVKRIKSHKYE